MTPTRPRRRSNFVYSASRGDPYGPSSRTYRSGWLIEGRSQASGSHPPAPPRAMPTRQHRSYRTAIIAGLIWSPPCGRPTPPTTLLFLGLGKSSKLAAQTQLHGTPHIAPSRSACNRITLKLRAPKGEPASLKISTRCGHGSVRRTSSGCVFKSRKGGQVSSHRRWGVLIPAQTSLFRNPLAGRG